MMVLLLLFQTKDQLFSVVLVPMERTVKMVLLFGLNGRSYINHMRTNSLLTTVHMLILTLICLHAPPPVLVIFQEPWVIIVANMEAVML